MLSSGQGGTLNLPRRSPEAIPLLDKHLRRQDERSLLEAKMKGERRLPPGQSLTLKWPVLHEGEVPAFDPGTWDLRVGGLVETPLELGYTDFLALARTEVSSDFHCVTRSFRELRQRVQPRPEATHVMVLGHRGDAKYGYTTNLPLTDLERPGVLFAQRNRGRDLDPEHGWPLRLVVPHLYAWKSCKWVRGLIFMDRDEPGYWEENGYHMRGDPFREERFS